MKLRLIAVGLVKLHLTVGRLAKVRIIKTKLIMEYKGKLYGKVHKSYFPLEATTDEWDAMVKRISELEAENQALLQPPVVGQSEQLFCHHEGKYTLKSDGNCCKCHLPPNPKVK